MNKIKKPSSIAGTVLVTGGSGFLARWCIVLLLKQGYRVQTTVQDLSEEPEIRGALAEVAEPKNRLTFFQANLLRDEGWSDAARGCDYVLHIASPFPAIQPKNEDDVIIPARDGALRVIKASQAEGVKRVVMTTSSAAMAYPDITPRPQIITEEYWTDITRGDVDAYQRSKTIAERAAWDLMKQYKGDMTLTAIAPAVMIGPILGTHMSYSIQIVERLLNGSVPGIPHIGFGFADVRDIADLHIRAMTAKNAAGQRFLGGGEFLWMSDVAHILKDRLGPRATKVPTRNLPDFAVRLASIFDLSLRPLLKELSVEHHFSAEKAKRILDWETRPAEESIVDCAQSLITRKLVDSK